jgi:hypothetical protein
MDFKQWFIEQGQALPVVRTAKQSPQGIVLVFDRMPEAVMTAISPTKTSGQWYVKTTGQPFLVQMDDKMGQALFSKWRASKGLAAGPSGKPAGPKPQAGPMWFHRGIRGQWQPFTPKLQQTFDRAMQVWEKYYNERLPKDETWQRADQIRKQLGVMEKGQMFTSSVGDAVGDYGHGGGQVISIQLPPAVFNKYLGQGTARGAGLFLTIPGRELYQLSQQYPFQVNSGQDAMQKFGGQAPAKTTA